jgi:hypothetical protein
VQCDVNSRGVGRYPGSSSSRGIEIVRRTMRKHPEGVLRALEHLGPPAQVLERHGVTVRGRMAFCPFHPNARTPAMSLFKSGDRERAKCHSCGWHGDALDLEAALSHRSVAEVIRGR